MILVTGGAGFIGSHFILSWFDHGDEAVVNIDKLTYAGNVQRLSALNHTANYIFIQGDIADVVQVEEILYRYHPRAIIHFAAESHIDRAIHEPKPFMQTNILGSFYLLEAACRYWQRLTPLQRAQFRFLHISTDEVYGGLAKQEAPIQEGHRYLPGNPYAASKAASDHLVWAWHHTYGLPIFITHASNNYGAYQDHEKLIPATIMRLLNQQPAQLYGDGQQKRDWLYVDDHCAALRWILDHGKVGETYHIGAGQEKTNLEVVDALCDVLECLQPNRIAKKVQYIPDRLGHDQRYAMDTTKLHKLGWYPKETFETGIIKTVKWYINHVDDERT
ncbi:MAG: dTDP-glucose 4,6-dehydratase [Neisseriales bacterium]|nr:MAG: dTDP-glucose 4,6-dehydratase [Neisseriales bacterium]